MLSNGWSPRECSLQYERLILTKPNNWSIALAINVVTLEWVPRIMGNPEDDDQDFLLLLDHLADFSDGLKQAMGREVKRFRERLWHTSMPGAKREKKSVENQYVSSTPAFGKPETGKRK